MRPCRQTLGVARSSTKLFRKELHVIAWRHYGVMLRQHQWASHFYFFTRVPKSIKVGSMQLMHGATYIACAGSTSTASDYQLDTETQCRDIGALLEALYQDGPPPVVLAGHRCVC
jgi:hypothetical protein